MGYVTPSDPLLRFALYCGLAVFLLSLVLLVAIAVLRYATDRREALEAALTERWEPVFHHAVEGLPYVTPRIYGRDREVIMLVWIHFIESLRGEATCRLRRLARELRLDGTALRLLDRRDLRSRLLAVATLGRIKSKRSWRRLEKLVADPSPMLSLLAARSLLQIDAARAMPFVLAGIIRRDDWPLTKLVTVLGEVPADVLAPPLLTALEELAPEHAPRLLGLLDTAHPDDIWPVLAPFLQADQPAATIAAALKACRDPRGLDAIRALTAHPAWIVRVHAATALGRLGSHEDSLRLQAMLADPEWWVRYRAGLALVQMPFVPRQRLVELCPRLGDHFAADMLRQVLAETAPESRA